MLLSLLRHDCNMDNWVEIACSCVLCDDREASTLDMDCLKSFDDDVLRTLSETEAGGPTSYVGVLMSLAHIRLQCFTSFLIHSNKIVFVTFWLRDTTDVLSASYGWPARVDILVSVSLQIWRSFSKSDLISSFTVSFDLCEGELTSILLLPVSILITNK